MTTWGLQIFDRFDDARVVESVARAGFGTVRIQASPESLSRRGLKNASAAAAGVATAVHALERRGFVVWVSPYSSPADMRAPIPILAYLERLAALLPNRVFLLDAELDQPKIAPPGGLEDLVVMAEAMVDFDVQIAGPGQTYPHLEHTRRALDRIRFDIPTLHAYPDRGPSAFGGWLDDAQKVFESYGYRRGALTEVGAHGKRSRPMGLLLWTWLDWLKGLGSWDAQAQQADRLRGVRREIERRSFWTHALVYQVADAPPGDPDEGHPEGFGLYGPDALTPKPALGVFAAPGRS